jgi:hypothetical protein
MAKIIVAYSRAVAQTNMLGSTSIGWENVPELDASGMPLGAPLCFASTEAAIAFLKPLAEESAKLLPRGGWKLRVFADAEKLASTGLQTSQPIVPSE